LAKQKEDLKTELKVNDAPPFDVKKLAKQNEDLKNDVYDLKNQSCHHLGNFIEENRKKSVDFDDFFFALR